MSNKIIVFGDSIARGALDTESGGWVGRLQSSADWDIYNFAFDGATVADIIKIFSEKMDEVGQLTKNDYICFAVGINDSWVFADTSKNNFTQQEFKSNFSTLIKKAQEKTNNICLIGLSKVNENLVSPFYGEYVVFTKMTALEILTK